MNVRDYASHTITKVQSLAGLSSRGVSPINGVVTSDRKAVIRYTKFIGAGRTVLYSQCPVDTFRTVIVSGAPPLFPVGAKHSDNSHFSILDKAVIVFSRLSNRSRHS